MCVGPRAQSPRLSVLTPFYRYDPAPMLAALAGAPRDVEIVLLDDGSRSATLLSSVIAAAERTGAPVRVIVWEDNRGRAEARNRLITEARGEYVLFLDADMIPESPRFLHTWLALIQSQRPFTAFGGLSLANVSPTSETALHHDPIACPRMCASAAARKRWPAPICWCAATSCAPRRSMRISPAGALKMWTGRFRPRAARRSCISTIRPPTPASIASRR
ncbi:MAG TPA: glycosyltransferase family A protein [Terricaulis sp.]|nr:glycosyltransferase family A protein [Terricaulis sp.]